MRHSSSPHRAGGGVTRRLRNVWRQFTQRHTLLLTTLSIFLIGIILLTPYLYFILRHLTYRTEIGLTLLVLTFVTLLGLIGLRRTEPGYILLDTYANETPLNDMETLQILHKWSDSYPWLIQLREDADERDGTHGDSQDISLASSCQDQVHKETLQAILLRMSSASKLGGEEGQIELDDATRDLQNFIAPSQAALNASLGTSPISPLLGLVGPNQLPPPEGWSLTNLPPPPSRPYYLSPTSPKHIVLEYDREQCLKIEHQYESNLTQQQRKERKKQRRKREERRKYEMRRKDGETPISNDMMVDLPIQHDLKDGELSMASATEEEQEESMRSRVSAPPLSAPSASSSSSSSAAPSTIPNPFANADNFFRHDFVTHPIADTEKERLIARARYERETNSSINASSSTNIKSGVGNGGVGNGGAVVGDDFSLGSPRWNPRKLRDDLERFSIDRFGLREEFCLECMVWRPLGTRHCSKCQLCVYHPIVHTKMFGGSGGEDSNEDCCIGRKNVRFLIILQLMAVLIAWLTCLTSFGLLFGSGIIHHDEDVSSSSSSSPSSFQTFFSWSTWRLPLKDGLREDGSSNMLYTWNYILIFQTCITFGWFGMSLVTTLLLLFNIFEICKTSNYILLGEGGGLTCEGPFKRIFYNPFQLLLYIDMSSVVQYFMERIVLSDLTACTWNPFERHDSLTLLRQRARHLAKERRQQWKRLREEARRAAAAADPTLAAEGVRREGETSAATLPSSAGGEVALTTVGLGN